MEPLPPLPQHVSRFFDLPAHSKGGIPLGYRRIRNKTRYARVGLFGIWDDIPFEFRSNGVMRQKGRKLRKASKLARIREKREFEREQREENSKESS